MLLGQRRLAEIDKQLTRFALFVRDWLAHDALTLQELSAMKSIMKLISHRHLAPSIIFPLVMSAALVSTWAMIQQDIAPSMAALIVVLCGMLTVAVLERLLPYRVVWNQSHGDFKVDMLYMAINSIIPKLWTPVLTAALVVITAGLSQRFGQSFWPSQWHWLPELALMLLIAEFGRYWVHRAAHTWTPLWRLHAVHHSSSRLYFLNANRFHLLEKLIFQLPEVVPFIILGTPAEIIALYFTFNSLHGMFQHSNIRIRGGLLNYVFSLTELHRWHHSRVVAESDQNYGNNLIVWDILFGTYFNPRDREVEDIGLLNPQYPQNWSGQLLAPFAQRDISKPEAVSIDTADWASTEEGNRA